MCTLKSYLIARANFSTSQFRLIPDRYFSLVSQFNSQPLRLPFIKVVNTPCRETIGKLSKSSSRCTNNINKMIQYTCNINQAYL
jgi:hypothetical protein